MERVDLVTGPDAHQREEFLEAVRQRDQEQLRQLVNHLYPNVAWGKITKTLLEEERNWALMSLTQDERHI